MSADEAPSDLILNPLRLIVRETENAGRGVFAPADIPAGSVLEEAPVLVLTKEEWETGKLNDGVLGGYAFNWSGGGMAVALGIACMFNHSSSPNVNYTRLMSTKIRPDQRPSLRFTAFRKIRKGEELFISYSADASKLWFDQGEAAPDADSDTEADPLPMGGDDERTQPAKKTKDGQQRAKMARKAKASQAKADDARRLDDDYEAALERLGLAPPLAISAQAIAAEERAIEAEPGRWKLVQRIPGPVEDDDEG